MDLIGGHISSGITYQDRNWYQHLIGQHSRSDFDTNIWLSNGHFVINCPMDEKSINIHWSNNVIPWPFQINTLTLMQEEKSLWQTCPSIYNQTNEYILSVIIISMAMYFIIDSDFANLSTFQSVSYTRKTIHKNMLTVHF
jgi:hypothetical protein